MAKFTIAVFPGDGIGNDITKPSADFIGDIAKGFGVDLDFEYVDAGAYLYAKTGDAFPEENFQFAAKADAIYLAAMGEADGLIMTLFADDPKWSFIRYDEQRLVTMVREKEVISNEATVGIYNYRHGKDFVAAAHQMIDQNIRVNGEFYVAPVYNEMIRDGKKITFHNIGEHMYGLGIPEDLEAFVKLPISRQVFHT